jgi:hypothetical protein
MNQLYNEAHTSASGLGPPPAESHSQTAISASGHGPPPVEERQSQPDPHIGVWTQPPTY